MITDSKYPNVPMELFGLSTDTKPTDRFNGVAIPNGSAFLEMDTGTVYVFDSDSDAWNAL